MATCGGRRIGRYGRLSPRAGSRSAPGANPPAPKNPLGKFSLSHSVSLTLGIMQFMAQDTVPGQPAVADLTHNLRGDS